MKPIIIEKDKTGNVKITLEELREIVDNAYNQGYNDGRNSNTSIPSVPSWAPTWTDRDHITITCKSLPCYL